MNVDEQSLNLIEEKMLSSTNRVGQHRSIISYPKRKERREKVHTVYGLSLFFINV